MIPAKVFLVFRSENPPKLTPLEFSVLVLLPLRRP